MLPPDFPVETWILALTGTLILGISKTGLPGLALVNIIIMASLFGKESVGIVLPLLIVCDLIIYPMYRKYASWSVVWPLLIPILAGVVAGWLILDAIPNDTAMKRAIGGIILAMLGLQILRNVTGELLRSWPDSTGFRIGSGLVIGVSTTIANAAGPAYSIWAVVRRIPKEDFLGIGARVFLFVNIFKLPFNANLGILNLETLAFDLFLLPALVIGIFIGRKIVLRIPQKAFERILLVLALFGSVWLLLS